MSNACQEAERARVSVKKLLHAFRQRRKKQQKTRPTLCEACIRVFDLINNEMTIYIEIYMYKMTRKSVEI